MSFFKHNMDKTDRIRAVLGVLLIGNVFFALQHPVGWIGVILLATAIFGICPLYSLLNLNTKSTVEKGGLKKLHNRISIWNQQASSSFCSSAPSSAGSCSAWSASPSGVGRSGSLITAVIDAAVLLFIVGLIEKA